MAILLVVIAIVVVIVALIWNSASKGAAENQALDAATNQSLLAIEGFNPAIVHKGFAGQYGIALDPATERFAISIPGSAARAYHFSQLVAVEVDRDGTTITTTKGKISTGSAAVATAIAGPVGGLLMGVKTSSTSTTDETVMLSLKLYVDDLFTPCFTISFGGGFKDEFGADRMLKEATGNVDAWFGRFKAILMSMEGRRPVGHNPDAIIHTAPAPAPIALGWSARVFAP